MSDKIKNVLQTKADEQIFPSTINIQKIIDQRNHKKIKFKIVNKKYWLAIGTPALAVVFFFMFILNQSTITVNTPKNQPTSISSVSPTKIMAIEAVTEPNFLIYNGEQFTSTSSELADNQIGDKLAIIETQSSKKMMGIQSTATINNSPIGNTNLPIGTEIYSIKNSNNLAVKIDGKWVLLTLNK
jgi:hypothetical protein